MEKKDKYKVVFELIDITTEQFAFIESNFDVEELDYGINFSVAFKLDSSNKVVGTYVKFDFYQDTKQFLIVELACHFEINNEAWNKFYNSENNTITIPKDTLVHMVVLTVGTARGFIHAKRTNKMISIILPTFNVTQEVPDDLNFILIDEE